MRSKPAFNFPAFFEAEAALQAAGHDPFNPAKSDTEHGFDLTKFDGTEDLNDIGFNLRDALGDDLAWITTHADGVAVLPGWASSKGAKAEVATADALNIPVRNVDHFVQHPASLEPYTDVIHDYAKELAAITSVPLTLIEVPVYEPAIGDRVRIVDADYLNRPPTGYWGTVTDLAADRVYHDRPHPIRVTDDDGRQWYAVEVELVAKSADEDEDYIAYAEAKDAAYVKAMTEAGEAIPPGLAEAIATNGFRQKFICGVDPDEACDHLAESPYQQAKDYINARYGSLATGYDAGGKIDKPPPEYPTPEVRTIRALNGEHGVTEVRLTSVTGGAKGSKPARFDLIPTGPLWELAEHYGKGAQKYERVNGKDNWRNGYDWSLSYAALQRHANAFWNGEDIDAETGSKHIIAAAWHCLALAHFMDDDGLELFDDRQEGV